MCKDPSVMHCIQILFFLYSLPAEISFPQLTSRVAVCKQHKISHGKRLVLELKQHGRCVKHFKTYFGRKENIANDLLKGFS